VNGIDRGISGSGGNEAETAIRLSGPRIAAAHGRKWVDSRHSVFPGLTRGSTVECFFIKSCNYCLDWVMDRRNDMARILQAAWLVLAA
jgi:hypothetical protein